MTKSIFLTTAASLTLVSAALFSAQGFARGDDGAKHGHSDDGARHGRADEERMTLLERLDTNADGVLDLDEFTVRNAENTQRHFNKKDADGDELLSLDEFSAIRNHRRHPNGDTLDTDAIDYCMEEVLGYELPDRPDSATAFAATDANSDGSVDLEEFLGADDLRAAERFAELDIDGDAQLASYEIEEHRELRREQHDARRYCVAEQMEEDDLLN